MGSSAESFAQKFCRHYGVPARRYPEEVLRLTLHPHARWLTALRAPAVLAADRRFVAGVGRLVRWRDFADEVQTFRDDPRNALFHRRTLRLRVSVTRMRMLFTEVWDGGVPAAAEAARDERRAGDDGSLLPG